MLLCAAGNYGFPGCTTTCFENGECREKEFCRHPDGACDDEGICENRPIGCPKNLDPVCGCDGVTYDNDCFAAMAGVSVDYEGECEPEYCWSNEMCRSDERYCFFEDCDLETGVCMDRPTGCPDVWDPVCGCDGLTYGNACEAAAAGMSVDYEGECEPVICWDNAQCGDDWYCFFEECELESGFCELRPEDCPDGWDPVCGCDGLTYATPCDAAIVGMSVDYVGVCVEVECRANTDCSSDLQYCEKPVGECDGAGLCETRPNACPDVWDPVCGCDGGTYGNACEAAAAGVSVDYEGECLEEGCLENGDCPAENQYCEKAVGACEERGECVVRPEICPDVWMPVCGCDGLTYSNDCYAAAAGVSVDYEGMCVEEGCASNADCMSLNQFCRKPLGLCEERGACAERPEYCLDYWDPVCGCDGETYSNTCYAHRAGVSVDYDEACVTPEE